MPRKSRVAVIDTTLLSRLVDAGLADRLPFIFDRVHVPVDVKWEIGKGPGHARRKLRTLFKKAKDFYKECREEDPAVRGLLDHDLDPGEAAVIAQAEEIRAVVIIDEELGCRHAALMSIKVHKTGSILCMLKEAGAIECVRVYLERLESLGFWLSRSVFQKILVAAGEADPPETRR